MLLSVYGRKVSQNSQPWPRHGRLAESGKGSLMRQLHVKEPWAGLAYSSDREMFTDLVSRMQVLEHRIRELEEMVRAFTIEAELPQQEPLPISS